MSRIALPQKDPNSTINVVFDFISSLGSSETISTSVCTCSVYNGIDLNPSSVIGATSSSGTQVTQTLLGGVNGVTYTLTCTITTSLSQTLTLSGYLAVLQPTI